MSLKKIGKAYIKVDGKLLDSLPGAKIDIGGVTRKTVTGSHNVGFSEENKPSKIECEIMFDASTSLRQIADISDATVTFECDTGQIYVVRNAWVSETLTLNETEGGKVAVVIEGPAAEEVM